MPITAAILEAVLRRVPGALGHQVASLDVLASGANTALAAAPSGLTAQGAAAFLATMAQESASFRTTEEYSKTGPYAPYIGRTFEQLTWESNYRVFGYWCRDENLLTDPLTFVKSPNSLADIKWAWLGGLWFWEPYGIWAYANRGDFLATQRAVNLGNPLSTKTPNGIAARNAWYAAFLVAGNDLLPAAPAPAPKPTPTPEADVPVNFRGGKTCTCVATSLPVVEQLMIAEGLIKHNIDIYQLGYRNDVSASAGTHAAGGNTDVAQFSDAQIDCWRRCGWTIQHRTKAQGFDMDHGHGWPLGCTHLSPGGRSQATQWANGTNGLVSKGRIQGRYPIVDWKAGLKYAQNRIAAIKAANQQKEEDELPTPADVTKDILTRDGLIENVFTGNPDNKFVALQTAVVVLGKRTRDAEDRQKRIEAKLDALIARFPAAK